MEKMQLDLYDQWETKEENCVAQISHSSFKPLSKVTKIKKLTNTFKQIMTF